MSRPLPADPARWFSDEELRRADAYHRPLRRAAQIGDLALLVTVAVLWWRAPVVGVAAGVLGVVVAIRAVVGDLVMDRVAEPSVGAAPLPLARLLVSSLSAALLKGTLAAGLVVAVDAVSSRPWLPFAIAVVLVGIGLFVAERWFDLVHRPEAASHVTAARLAELAADAGVPVPLIQRSESPAFVGPTAMTLGVSAPRIVVTEELEGAASELRDWVLTHELAHVRHRDVGRARRDAALAVALTVATGSVVLASLDLVPTRRAIAVVIVAGVAWTILQLVLLRRSRAVERRADDEAARQLGPRPAVVRALVSGPRARLDPTMWDRLTAAHPAPAERIRRMTSG